jgi:hypothetical protein
LIGWGERIIHASDKKDFNDQNKRWGKYTEGLWVFGSLAQRPLSQDIRVLIAVGLSLPCVHLPDDAL